MDRITTKCGSDVITQARELVEQTCRPLELGTDGMLRILSHGFPDACVFHKKGRKK